MTKPTKTTAPGAKPKTVTKLDTLIGLLKQPGGADLSTMTAATGWQAHSVRGALAGAVRKKGHSVESGRIADRRVWRIVESVA